MLQIYKQLNEKTENLQNNWQDNAKKGEGKINSFIMIKSILLNNLYK